MPVDEIPSTGTAVAAPAASEKKDPKAGGLKIPLRWTDPHIHPYDQITWERRRASIQSEKGEMVFDQGDVEIPAEWSMTATNVVASKYFKKNTRSGERESSVRQLIDRVALTVSAWGRKGEYFASEADAKNFERELTAILVRQHASFNSPVWFNVGLEEKPQCSACFINAVEDSMGAILDLAKTEGMLFKYGSGTGSNLSNIRSSKEELSGGGSASGPVSFMRGFDSFAGVIKSGGKTRRAAKMVILNADHPDILEFVRCKADEEKKAWVLIDAGYDGNFNVKGGAYDSIQFQNANHSVRVSDDFMKAVESEGSWQTKSVREGIPLETMKAKDLLRSISEAAWICGDPGIQFDTIINDWHTCPQTAPINASNPCSEYMFLDDSACNLASINLMKYLDDDGNFDIEGFRHTVRVLLLAQEILVDNASYPTPKIATNSHDYRPLGLGYANLGALLMSLGMAYDSDEGRNLAGALTALMHGEANRTSAEIAAHVGPFRGFPRNRTAMLRVMRKHKDEAYAIPAKGVPAELLTAVHKVWDKALELGEKNGYRNGQVTVLAPTGTIAFMMDCDTTGVEPDIALVKYKKLVGGGMMKLVNRTVPRALKRVGYSSEEVTRIVDYIDKTGTIEGAPALKDEHLSIFDCAFKPAAGKRSIHYMGHVRMMGATQPFLSGAISKTVNMPTDATVEEISHTYVQAWKLGLKSIAIYRDGCKRTQPLSTSRDGGSSGKKPGAKGAVPVRRRLPDERKALTHKFSVGGHEGYITVGMYEDGKPGEIFITMAKEGSVVSGLMDTVATATSISLQYGVPLDVLVNKFSHTRFEPSGFTGNPEIPMAKSVIDYVFRWLAMKFLAPDKVPADESKDGLAALGAAEGAAPAVKNPLPLADGGAAASFSAAQFQQDAPPCPDCGSIMVRSAACYKCLNCGTTNGCS